MPLRALILDSARARLGDLGAVFHVRPFAVYQIGGILMTTGFWMQRVAVGWIMWELTGSGAWLGLVAFAELFPALLTGLWGGALADRHAAPVVMFWGNLSLVATSAAMWAADVAGIVTPVFLVAAMTVVGAVSGLILPARLALPRFLVPVQLLPAGLAVNSMGFNLSRLVGPAVAALMLVAGSTATVLAAAALGYAAFSLSLHLIRDAAPHAPQAGADDAGSAWSVIRAMPQVPLVLAVIGLQFAVGVLVRPAVELFPAFADVVFGQGEAGLGWLNGALGLGAVGGALVLARPRSGAAALRFVLWMTLIHAVTILGFVMSGMFAAALAFLVVHGVAMTASNIAAMAYVQLETPADRLGRVLSIYALVFRAGPALGALAFGLLAEAAGLRMAGIVFGILGIGAVVALGLFIRRNGGFSDA